MTGWLPEWCLLQFVDAYMAPRQQISIGQWPISFNFLIFSNMPFNSISPSDLFVHAYCNLIKALVYILLLLVHRSLGLSSPFFHLIHTYSQLSVLTSVILREGGLSTKEVG